MKFLVFLLAAQLSFSIPQGANCPSAFLWQGRSVDAVSLPTRVKRRVPIVFPLDPSLHAGGRETLTDFFVSTLDAPITPEAVIWAYSNGWKLYHHFDVEGTHPEWQLPAFRGIHNLAKTREIAPRSSIFSETKKLFFNKAEPLYDIRINFEPERVINFIANAEHSAQNTKSKEFLTDGDGKQFRWRKTWLSPAIQAAFLELILRGQGYTVAIYTNPRHPYHDPTVAGGKLVGACFGIQAGGGFTSVSTGMDRTPIAPGVNKLRYDGAGKITDFAELDFLESQGVTWTDSVTVNPLPRAFGAYFITREEHHQLLVKAHQNPVQLSAPKGPYTIRFDYWLKPK